MRRIVVTRAGTPLGRRVLAALRVVPEIEELRGVDSCRLDDRWADETFDVVPVAPDHRPFAEYLEKESFDTVIQCGVVPDRSGASSIATDADVISTMCLGAAIAHEGSKVRSWVLASSSSVYPIGSHSALVQSERHELPREDENLAASINEAEEYARDIALRHTHVNVAILRMQQISGPGVRGPLANLLARDPAPTPIGFDAAIQLLHLDDAASALVFAARRELSGIYNVASRGMIHWHEAVRATGHARSPVLPVSVGPFESVLGRLGVPFVPAELLDLMRFGHVVDISKIEAAGWQPQKDQLAILTELAREN